MSTNWLKMLSVNDVVKWVNERVAPLIPGLKSYGMAKSADLGEGKIKPYVAPGVYAGVDDVFKAQVYHKQNSIASTTVPRSGYGDDPANIQNTSGMSMFVFFNEEKCGFSADELYTYTLASITGDLKSDGMRSARVSVSNAILNDVQVWAQEYGTTPFKLKDSQRLIQINYSIVLVFDQNCIKIPNCKT